ncbi:hypothetical protein HID58_066832 [Brassica napus]|uniref:Uncharacterized protein n=1 Tax=Brassica napus TaxID=3708 RepID=A0ABQ7ZGU3_BRANA|nr:hypothetical protein HID58_066832 [Brassica napus]
MLAIPQCFRGVHFLMSKAVTPPAARTRPLPSRTVIGDSSLMDVRQRLLTELFLLRNRVRDMAAQRDLLIWQVRASARWELMKE